MADDSKKDDLLRVRVDSGLLKRLEEESEATGVDQSKIVREAIRQRLGMEPAPATTIAPLVDVEALERAIAAGAERVLERLAEMPGRLDVTLRAGLEGIAAETARATQDLPRAIERLEAAADRLEDVPQRAAPSPQTSPHEESAPATSSRPPPDPVEVAKALEAQLRSAETLGQLRTIMENVERAGLTRALKSRLYDVWMECETALKAGRRPPAAD